MKTLLSFASIAALAVALLPVTATGQGFDFPEQPIFPTTPVEWEIEEGYRVLAPNCAPYNYVAFDAVDENAEFVAPNGGTHLRWHTTPGTEPGCSGGTFTRITWVFPWSAELSGTLAQWYFLYDQPRFHVEIGVGECHGTLQVHLWEPPDPKITLAELSEGNEQGWGLFEFVWPDYPEGELAALEMGTLRIGDEDCGQIEAMDRHFLEALGLVAVANEGAPSELPQSATLLPAYPNPFNPSTTVPFVLSESGSVVLTVYDVLGRKVATLVDEVRTSGRHEVQFDAEGMPSGVYLVRLAAGDAVRTNRIVLAK